MSASIRQEAASPYSQASVKARPCRASMDEDTLQVLLRLLQLAGMAPEATVECVFACPSC
jgi:hypothetical protein